jgi:flagellar motility protein MotE (MotC chaperone)
MKRFRDFRLIPLVLVAIVCFGVVKVAGLLLNGGYVFRDAVEPGQRSWAQQNLNFPTGRTGGAPNKFEQAAGDITGSVEKAEPKAATAEPKTSTESPKETPLVAQGGPSASERAVLERLQSRRQELDSRARELEIRESLLKAHEQRIEARVEELKGTESRIEAATKQKDDADAARFKSIVTMYENMKPKDAAKIFDRMDMPVLIDVASRMKPQKMSDVLAQMLPDNAEKLTVELARRSGSGGDQAASVSDLPKIEGRPMAKSANQ